MLCFQVFDHGGQQLLSRAWLLDPVHTQVSATAAPKARGVRESEPWIGEFYASYGLGEGRRSWEEARRYGFISAGGGSWYSNTLNLLNVGDRIWVKSPGHGFVGVGEVTGRAQPLAEFVVLENGLCAPPLFCAAALPSLRSLGCAASLLLTGGAPAVAAPDEEDA